MSNQLHDLLKVPEEDSIAFLDVFTRFCDPLDYITKSVVTPPMKGEKGE